MWAFLLIIDALPVRRWTAGADFCAISFFPYALFPARAASRLESEAIVAFDHGCIICRSRPRAQAVLPRAWIAVELVVIAARRQRFPFLRNSLVDCTVHPVPYAILVIVATPEVLFPRLFCTHGRTYCSYGIGNLCCSRHHWRFGCFAVHFGVHRSLAFGAQRSRRLAQVFGALTVGSLFSYVVQSRGFCIRSRSRTSVRNPVGYFCNVLPGPRDAQEPGVAPHCGCASPHWRLCPPRILSLPVGVQLARNV